MKGWVRGPFAWDSGTLIIISAALVLRAWTSSTLWREPASVTMYMRVPRPLI